MFDCYYCIKSICCLRNKYRLLCVLRRWFCCCWLFVYCYSHCGIVLCFILGPKKHGLVTYIQVHFVNVYIGNTLSWLNGGCAFKTDICWRLNIHISVFFSAYLWYFFSQKAMVQYTILKTVFLYLLKVYPSLWKSARNLGTILAIFGTFRRNPSEVSVKRWENFNYFTVTCNISASHTWSKLLYTLYHKIHLQPWVVPEKILNNWYISNSVKCR